MEKVVVVQPVVQLRGYSAKILIKGKKVMTFAIPPFDPGLVQESIFSEEHPSW
jgi:hypothetical protein